MAAVKTNKSFAKRLRVTKTGKVLKRRPGQNHFRAKDRRAKQLSIKRLESFDISKSDLKRFLPYD